MGIIETGYNIIKQYQGSNWYIHKIKEKLSKGILLTEFEAKYSISNANYVPIKVERAIKVTAELGTKLYQSFHLEFVPTIIKVKEVIGEMGGTYHAKIQIRYDETKPGGIPFWAFIQKKGLMGELVQIDHTKLDVDFSPLDEKTKHLGRCLKEHQKDAAKFLIANKKAILAHSMGCGKEQDIETIIPTPIGFRRFGDLKLGDQVFGMDGKPTKVVGIFPHQNKDLYEITFSDGAVTNCGLDHLWFVKEPGESDWKVVSLEEIIKKGVEYKVTQDGETHYRYEIPMCQEVQYEERDLSVNPYLFGKIIAKGDKSIPMEYQMSSVKQRLRLLTGLLDEMEKGTDNNIYFVKSSRLAHSIVLLVESLGGAVRLTKQNEERYRLALFYKDATFHRNIVKVEKVSVANTMCIKVDNEDGGYLTSEYIVTHNTNSAIAAALTGGYKKILVIATASLKINWKREISLYEDEDNIEIVKGKEFSGDKKFTIINYDIIQNFYDTPIEIVNQINDNGMVVSKKKKSRDKEFIKKCMDNSKLFNIPYDCVIIDEAHKLSNKSSRRYQTIDDFLHRSCIQNVFLLTGTPFTNKLMNFYNLLKLIDANITNDYQYYVERFCGGKKKKLRDGRTFMQMGEPQNIEELYEKVKNVYQKLSLSDIGVTVSKNVDTRYYDLTPEQEKIYESLWDDYKRENNLMGMSDQELCKQLVEALLIRRFLAMEMIPNTIELAKEFIEEDEKVVIMCNFREEMDVLKKHFKDKAVMFDGVMSAKKKQESVDKFQNDPKIKVFIGQIVAASVGVTLTAAHNLIFNSINYSSTDLKQAEDRIYRMTSDKDANIIYQMFTDKISQWVMDITTTKNDMAEELIKKS